MTRPIPPVPTAAPLEDGDIVAVFRPGEDAPFSKTAKDLVGQYLASVGEYATGSWTGSLLTRDFTDTATLTFRFHERGIAGNGWAITLDGTTGTSATLTENATAKTVAYTVPETWTVSYTHLTLPTIYSV